MAEYNLKIYSDKTKTMAFIGKRTLRCKTVIDNKIIEQVNSFNYLGTNISHLINEDINTKLNKFGRICGIIRRNLRNKTRKDTQLKFYKTVATPILKYGCENWILNRKDNRKIEATERRFLRPLAGFTLLDHKRNTEIRDNLKIYNMTHLIEQQKRKWYEHVTRMEEKRLPNIILNYKPRGKRDRGRPRTRWMDHIS